MSPMPDIGVLVVDDQDPFRMAARSVVQATLGFELLGEATSGEEAVLQVEALSPGLVLMDITMDGIGGVEATRRIVGAHPGVRVLLLSTYDADDLPADARRCGATGYVHKEHFGPDILEKVMAGAGVRPVSR